MLLQFRGVLAFSYGRRPVLIFCFVMMAFTGVLAALSPTVLAFGVLRFLQGIFYTVRYYYLLPSFMEFLHHSSVGDVRQFRELR